MAWPQGFLYVLAAGKSRHRAVGEVESGAEGEVLDDASNGDLADG